MFVDLTTKPNRRPKLTGPGRRDIENQLAYFVTHYKNTARTSRAIFVIGTHLTNKLK